MSLPARALCEPTLDVASPLAQFYATMLSALPEFQLISGAVMPEPYRRLLVHARDMTPTLEAYHGQRMALRVLHKLQSASALTRQVVLVGNDNGPVAEFGAIRINLNRFETEARRMICESQLPLGAILRELQIEHTSRPTAYFAVRGDRIMQEALGSPCGTRLYGRHNQLRDCAGHLLAEVVEILPPERLSR